MPDIWEIVRVGAVMISATAACISVLITVKSRDLERRSRAPYLMVEGVSFSQVKPEDPLRLQVMIKNSGSNPARHLTVDMMMLADINEPEPASGRIVIPLSSRSNANGLPGGVTYTEYFRIQRDLPGCTHDILIFMHYTDPFFGHSYAARFYFQWVRGCKEDNTPSVDHLTREEKHLIDTYLADKGILIPGDRF